jgi:hypothetical protein
MWYVLRVLLSWIQLKGPWGTLTLALQCENTLNSWRSDLGKAGYAAVHEFWQANPIAYSSGKARAAYVEQALSGLRYVFRDPDALNVSPSVLAYWCGKCLRTDIGTIRAAAVHSAPHLFQRYMPLIYEGSQVRRRSMGARLVALHSQQLR